MRILVVALAALLVAAAPAGASCIRQTPAEQRARAQVILEGVVTSASGRDAVVRVERYRKGTGPREVRLAGAGRRGLPTSISIAPRPRERWLVLARRRGAGVLETTQCDGSRRLATNSTSFGERASGEGAPAADTGPSPVRPAVVAAVVVALLLAPAALLVARRAGRQG